jgi:hypothetical protein
LQRLEVDERIRVQEFERIAQGFKNPAMDLNCITLLVTQQNAEGGAKWSTAVYEATDHYWVLSEKPGNRQEDTEKAMKLNVTKNKNGNQWSNIDIYWHPAIFRFYAESQVANKEPAEESASHTDGRSGRKPRTFNDEVSDYFTENGIKHRRLRR